MPLGCTLKYKLQGKYCNYSRELWLLSWIRQGDYERGHVGKLGDHEGVKFFSNPFLYLVKQASMSAWLRFDSHMISKSTCPKRDGAACRCGKILCMGAQARSKSRYSGVSNGDERARLARVFGRNPTCHSIQLIFPKSAVQWHC